MKAQAGVNTLTQRHCKPRINMYTDGPYTRKYVQPRARKYSQRKYIARNTKDEHYSEATTLPVHLKGHGSPDQSSGGSFDGFRSLSLFFPSFLSLSFYFLSLFSLPSISAISRPSLPFPFSSSSLTSYSPFSLFSSLPFPTSENTSSPSSLFPLPSLFFPSPLPSSPPFPPVHKTGQRGEGRGATLSPARDQRPLWYGMV